MEKRLLERRTENLPTLRTISRISEILSSDDGAKSKYEDVALQLLRLASTAPRKHVRHLLGSREYRSEGFDYDLLAAAIATKNMSIVKRLVNIEPKESSIFGQPALVAVRTGNYEALDILLVAPAQQPVFDTPFSIRLLEKAVTKKNMEMFEYLFGSRHLHSFATLFEANARYLSVEETALLLHTPSVEIFDTVLAELKARTQFCVDWKWLPRVLKCALSHGWVDMTRHILSFEEPAFDLTLDDTLSDMLMYRACLRGHAEVVKVFLDYSAKTSGVELRAAASHGHISILEILLKNGADINSIHAQNSLYDAARKGFVDIVRLLLDSGTDPNAGDTPPLIGAVESEHIGIFRLLVERGGDVARVIPEAKRRGEAAGLDSMVELLGEYEPPAHSGKILCCF